MCALRAEGETALVTDRNRVVTEIARHPPKRGEAGPEERYAEAVRAGWITPAPRSGGPIPAAVPSSTLTELLVELEQDRDS